MQDTNIIKSIDSLTEKSFGSGAHFIVDSSTNLPIGREIRYGLCLTDVTGFSAEDASLEDDSGVFPTALVAGIELPSGIKNISILDGFIFCVFK